MADFADLIVGAVNRVGPVPSSGPQIVTYAGGRAETVRAISGMSGPPRRRDYASDAGYREASKRWRSASRQVQRWTTGAREQRGRSRVRLAAGPIERLIDLAVTVKWSKMLRHGARVKFFAVIRVSSPRLFGGKGTDTRQREMPSGPGGVYLSPEEIGRVLADLDGGDVDAAVSDLLEAFGESYGFEGFEIEDVVWVKVWPHGEHEPPL